MSSAVAAAVVVAASLVVHGQFVEHDRDNRRESAGATAELVAARVQGRLRGVLLTLETAAASEAAELDARTATMRARGAVTTVARIAPDGRPITVVGPPATFEFAPTVAFNTARDTGVASLDRPAVQTSLVAIAPVYRGVPQGTADRRESLDGYVVGVVDVKRLVLDSVPPDSGAKATMSDGGVVVAAVGTGSERGPLGRQQIEAGGQAYPLALRVPPASTRFPTLPLCGLVIAALIAGAGGATVRARRRAERSAAAREQELTLVAGLGALLQESLDLEVILPAAALRLSEQLDLDGFAVLRVDHNGRLAQAFALGASPTDQLGDLASLRSAPEVIPAETETLFPLQPAGRVTGALWIRTRRALDSASVRSVKSAADLLASALANADAFDQERESVRRLEELDHIKNRFIGTVSHEMRTSASAISGFANLLGSRWDRLDDEERRDLVVRIERNGESLVSVVEDFLDFSRLERRSPASDPPPASLSTLVATAVEDLASLAPQHIIETRIAPDVAAFVDRPAIDRILANLVSNAAKYSPAGSTVTITVDDAGETAMLVVDDEGPGIPSAEREKVFDPFYRAGDAAVAGTRGAGIGLAVVKEVVDRLRARVSIEDSPSGGARLIVAFRAVSSPLSRSALLTGVSDGQ
jgi:signal transduction histidine kinase